MNGCRHEHLCSCRSRYVCSNPECALLLRYGVCQTCFWKASTGVKTATKLLLRVRTSV